jgi:hypothetical protein
LGTINNFSLEELTRIKCWLQFGIKTKEIAASLGGEKINLYILISQVYALVFELQGQFKKK